MSIDLQQIIPSQVINCSSEQACINVLTFLLKSYLKQDTNITQLLSTIQTTCPTLVNSLSELNLSTLENLNKPANQQTFINLIIGAVMSGASLLSTIKTLQLNITSDTIYDASFRILVSLLLVTLIQKSPNFSTLIQNQTFSTQLFSLINLLQSSYMALMNSSHLLDEVKQFLAKVGLATFNEFDTCCKCACNPFKSSSTQFAQASTTITPAQAQETIALRTTAFQHAVTISNLKATPTPVTTPATGSS